MKKALIILIALLLIGTGIYFFINSSPRTKTPEEQIIEEIEDDFKETQIDYKNAFIQANTTFTCQILAGEIDPANQLLAKEKLNQAYKDQGFPVDNDQELIQILDQYQNEEEVIALIKANVQACK